VTILLINFPQQLAAALRSIVSQAGLHTVAAESVVLAPSTLPPQAAHAVFVYGHAVDADAVAVVKHVRQAGYRPIYVVCERCSEDWTERVYLAGASFVFSDALRGDLILELLSRGSHQPIAESVPSPSASEVSSPPVPPLGRTHLLSELRDFSRLLRANNDGPELIHSYLDKLRELLGLNRAALFLSQGTTKTTMDCVYAVGLPRELWEDFPLSMMSGLGLLNQTQQVALHLSTLPTGPHGADARRQMSALGMQWAVPLATNGELLGVFLAATRATGRPLAFEEIELVFLLLEELAGALVSHRRMLAVVAQVADIDSVIRAFPGLCLMVDLVGEVQFANAAALSVAGCETLRELQTTGIPAPLREFVRSGTQQTTVAIANKNYRFSRAPVGDGRRVCLLLGAPTE